MNAPKVHPKVSDAFNRMGRAVTILRTADGDPDLLELAIEVWDAAVDDALEIIRAGG